MNGVESRTRHDIRSQVYGARDITSTTHADVQSKTEFDIQSKAENAEKEAFLYTARVNAAQVFSKYL